MHSIKSASRYLSVFFAMTMICISSFAATVQIPDWYKMSASLTDIPTMGSSFEVVVKLEALIGNLNDTEVRVIIPEGWSVEKAIQKQLMVKQGQTAEIRFPITPGSFLSNATIVVEAALRVPVNELSEYIKREFPDSAEGMIESVKGWPAVSKRYTDVAFALLAEESFYPLSGDMWLSYDDRMAPQKEFRGPVFYQDPIVTAHQAQTDLEMFEKLENYLKADPQMLEKLAESGIDVEKKRHDQMIALYVLAAGAFVDRKHDLAIGFLDRLESQFPEKAGSNFESLRIAAANLRGLSFWANGQRRLAEEFLKKAFYINRKNPVQRYVLRNIGLLMIAAGDRDTAAEMFRLGLNMKPGYTVMSTEAGLVRKN